MCTHWKLERERPKPGFLTEGVILCLGVFGLGVLTECVIYRSA